jgi:hypothetical protein
MAEWWESAPLAPADDPAFTGYIPGTPKPKDTTPSGYVRNPDGSLMPQKGGPADPYRPGGELDPNKPVKDGKAQESERTAAYLTSNMLTNVNLLNDAVKADPSAVAPTLGQEFAGLFGQTARNFATPAQRQAAYNAQRLIVDSALTLGTGAAYTSEQIDAYTRGFFPQVGDSPEAIASKRKALRGALLAARIKAGNEAPKIDEAISALGLDTEGGFEAGRTAPEGGVTGKRLTEEQEKEFLGWLQAKPRSAAEINDYLAPLGVSAANAEDVAAGKTSGAISYSKADEQARARAEEHRKREDAVSKRGSDPLSTLVQSGATLNLSDEASGIGNAAANLITSPLTGNLDLIGSYKVGRDAERLRIADAREQLGYGGTALEVAGGFVSANPAAALAPFVSARQLVGQGARAGAYGGALAGFGMGEGLEDSATSALIGGGVGAGLGAGVSALSSRYAARGMDPELARLADAEQVRVSQPMIEGNRRAINRAGVLEADSLTAPTIQQGFRDTADDIGAGIERLADPARAATPEAAGAAVQDAGRRFITRSRGVARNLYDRATRLAGGATVDAQRARSTLDNELADLRQAPETNRAEIAFLEGLRSDLDGPLTVDAIRAIRTGLRGSINQQGLTASQAEARAMRVLNAARDDIEASVPADAARAYRRADAFYAERQEHISDVVQRFLGRRNQPLSAEAAFQRLKGMASPGGDGRRLSAIMRNLDRDERQEVASTIASTLGRRGPEEGFSPDLLISQATKLSPSARRVIFGPDGAESMGNLIELSRRLQSARSEINRSKTARPVLATMGTRAKSFVAALLGVGGYGAAGVAGGIGAVAAGAGIAAAAAGRRVLSARALMNPRVTRWLAQAANVQTPAQAQQTVRRLGTVISREPALAGELQPIHDFLTRRVTAGMASADPQVENADGGDDE